MDRRRFVATIGSVLAAQFALAQQPSGPVRIGILAVNELNIRSPFWKPLFAALAKRGWHEDVEYALVLKEARDDPAQLSALADELIAERADIVLAFSSGAALAARRASDQTPIVTWCGYPVEAGLAASLARPGGSVTGVTNYAGLEIWGKFIELLRELRPNLRELVILWDYAPPVFPEAEALAAVPVIERSAKSLGIRSRTWMVRREQELIDALSAIDRSPADALMLTAGGGIHGRPAMIKRIGELIVRQKLPAITDIAAGFFGNTCTLAYSPNVPEALGRLAYFVDRILRGARPGELPFEQPSRFDLAVNVKAARAIGLAIPQQLLLRADRVIE